MSGHRFGERRVDFFYRLFLHLFQRSKHLHVSKKPCCRLRKVTVYVRVGSKSAFEGFAPKMPFRKLRLFAYVISQKRSANQQNDAFHVKISQSAKNKLHPTKTEIRLKKRHTPLLRESLQLLITVWIKKR